MKRILFFILLFSCSIFLTSQADTSTSPSSSPPSPSNANENYDELEDLFILYQPYLTNISAYNPMYFLLGTNLSKSKFQISFKYQLFDKKKQLSLDHPWISGLHFGYTQTSFWNLSSNSAAFEDTSYKPELFFLSSNIKFQPLNAKGFFMQTGLRHESNGNGGDLSRSTNTGYIKPILIYFDKDSGFGLQIAPKVWMYIHNDGDTNPDLDDYRGYFDVQVKTGKADGFVLDSTIGWANEGASIRSDFTYPLTRFFSNNFDIYLHIQYANTLAESLLKYQKRTEAFRIGFGIVR